jgi:hypothetical protein
VAEAAGDPRTKTDALRAAILERGVVIEVADDLGGALGTSTSERIQILNGLSPAETFVLLAHEYAHWLLHRADDRPASRDTRELEAEAVAFLVGGAVGLTPPTVTRLHPFVSRRPRGAGAVAHAGAADGLGDFSGDRERSGPGTSGLIRDLRTRRTFVSNTAFTPPAGPVYDCGHRVVAFDRAASGRRDGRST